VRGVLHLIDDRGLISIRLGTRHLRLRPRPRHRNRRSWTRQCSDLAFFQSTSSPRADPTACRRSSADRRLSASV